jgi:methylmalonyl-CoA mutase N-terminal domain/subunit
MQKYAAKYGIQMTAAEALKRVADGIGQDNYAAKQQERLKLVAKQLHPKLAAHIDAGGTVEDIADQYAYAKARKLGIAIPVSTTDSDVMNAVNSGISVSDFNIEMQKKPEWRKTDEARDMASDFTSTMLKTFGLG